MGMTRAGTLDSEAEITQVVNTGLFAGRPLAGFLLNPVTDGDIRPEAAIRGMTLHDRFTQCCLLLRRQERFVTWVVLALIVVAVGIVAVDELTGPALGEARCVGGLFDRGRLGWVAHQTDEIPVALMTLGVSRLVPLLNLLVGKKRRWPQAVVCCHVGVGEGLKKSLP